MGIKTDARSLAIKVRLMNTVQVKEIIFDFVLITYDIPEKAKKLRAMFLQAAREAGAEKHTASCYLMPYSEKTLALAQQLESAGHAVVWGPARQPDKEKATELTIKYKDGVTARCNLLEQRLVMGQQFIAQGKLGIARRMGNKTLKLLQQLVQIAETYQPQWFLEKLQGLVQKWQEVHG